MKAPAKSTKRPVNRQISQQSSSSVGSNRSTESTKKPPRKSKNAKNSTFKNSKRNESHPNIDSFTEIDTRVDTTSKVILKTSEDSKRAERDVSMLTFYVMSSIQMFNYFYILFALIYQVFYGDRLIWLEYTCMVIIEISQSVLILFLSPKYKWNTQSAVCLCLTLQYTLLFYYFSIYLQVPEKSEKTFFARLFGLSAVTLFSSVIHFFLVVESIEFLRDARQINDYSDKIIVESAEKREEEYGGMIKKLVDEIMRDDGNLKVFFSIKNETGHSKSLRGTGVETEVIRNFDMNSGENRINLSRNITTITCIDAPKEKEKKSVSKKTTVEESTVGPHSKFNKCVKQPKPLSPRKIL